MWEIFKKKPDPHDKAAAVAEEIAAIAQRQLGENLHCVVLYGSTVYGRPNKGSDIDILVVAKQFPPDIGERHSKLLSIAQQANRPQGLLHLNIVTEEEFSAYPPVHPAIFAAFMRGEWISPPKDQTST